MSFSFLEGVDVGVEVVGYPVDRGDILSVYHGVILGS